MNKSPVRFRYEKSTTYSDYIDRMIDKSFAEQEAMVNQVLPALQEDINNTIGVIWQLSNLIYWVTGLSYARGKKFKDGLNLVRPLLERKLLEGKEQLAYLERKVGHRYDPHANSILEDIEPLIARIMRLIDLIIDGKVRSPKQLIDLLNKAMERIGMVIPKSPTGRPFDSKLDSLYILAKPMHKHKIGWTDIANRIWDRISQEQVTDAEKDVFELWALMATTERARQLKAVFKSRDNN